MTDLKEKIEAYVKRVREFCELVRDNEQATKQALIDPLFTMLDFDLSDPRECFPEHRSKKCGGQGNYPIDWIFHIDSHRSFIVEAKAFSVNFDQPAEFRKSRQQLSNYFSHTSAELGILTNGVRWRFFTDGVTRKTLDDVPFATWDVLEGKEPPYEVIFRLQKSTFNMVQFRKRASRLARFKKRQSLVGDEKLLREDEMTVNEMVHCLYERYPDGLTDAEKRTEVYKNNPDIPGWPAADVAEVLEIGRPDDVKHSGGFRRNLARQKHQELLDEDYEILKAVAEAGRRISSKEISKILELLPGTLERPVLALKEDNYLEGVIGHKGGYQITAEGIRALKERPDPQPLSQERAKGFADIKALLGSERHAGYEDSDDYLKVHLINQKIKAFARLYFGHEVPLLWVRLPHEQAVELSGGRVVAVTKTGWGQIKLDSHEQVSEFGPLLIAAHDYMKTKPKKPLTKRLTGESDE